jgi:DNA polymerase I
MEMKFHLLDSDYFMNGNRAVVRLFGKSIDGKTVCAFYSGVMPYFYIMLIDEGSGREPEGKKFDEKMKELENFLRKNFQGLFHETEVVKRLLPIGHQKSKTTLVKIILTEPSKVPVVREELRRQPYVKEIYEADIPFKYRFMADRGLSGMRMVKVDGTSTQTKTVKTRYNIEAKSVVPVEDDDAPNLKYMSLDIEIASSREGLPDARRDKISMISAAFSPEHKGHDSIVLMVKHVEENGDDSVKTFSSEKEMLEEFLKTLNEFDPDVLIGYNINGFDLPYLIERYRQNRVPPTFGRCANKQARTRTFGMMTRSDVAGRVVVDAYELVKESASKGLIKLKRYGLGDVSRALLNEEKVDIAHSEIVKYWNGEAAKVQKLIDYSRKDSVLALKLVLEKNLLDKFIELSKVSGVLLQDALSSGEATRIETYLLREFNSAGYVVPSKPTPAETSRRNVERETQALKGAIVLEPETGLHTDAIVYLDFKSMYPSIYISYNICPTTLLPKDSKEEGIMTPYGVKFISKETKRGIIPQIVEQLITERDAVKKEMRMEKNEEKFKQLNAKQFALKIMANAFYGYTGYIRAKLYILDIANAITSCGRYLITRTRDIVDKDERFKVIYGDTDSVMVKTKTKDIEEAFELGEELEIMINTELEGIVMMKIESIFKTIVILTKKRYAGWSFEKRGDGWEDKIIMKGIETVRRDWCDLVSETLYDVLEIILKEQDPKKAFDHVREVLKKLQKNEIPIEKLIITKSISKPIRSYKGIQPHVELVKKMRRRNPTDAPGVGDRVGFVIVQGLQLLSNRAEDPAYIKEHDMKTDSKYYIENQMLPPLERVFESIGIDKSELLGMGKQTLLTSLFGTKKRSRRDSQSRETVLEIIDGVVCEKCGKTYKRPPLVGKCDSCGGSFLFFNGTTKSKYFSMAPLQH